MDKQMMQDDDSFKAISVDGKFQSIFLDIYQVWQVSRSRPRCRKEFQSIKISFSL